MKITGLAIRVGLLRSETLALALLQRSSFVSQETQNFILHTSHGEESAARANTLFVNPPQMNLWHPLPKYQAGGLLESN
jgi:hypothetical protein